MTDFKQTEAPASTTESPPQSPEQIQANLKRNHELATKPARFLCAPNGGEKIGFRILQAKAVETQHLKTPAELKPEDVTIAETESFRAAVEAIFQIIDGNLDKSINLNFGEGMNLLTLTKQEIAAALGRAGKLKQASIEPTDFIKEALMRSDRATKMKTTSEQIKAMPPDKTMTWFQEMGRRSFQKLTDYQDDLQRSRASGIIARVGKY